MRCMPAAASTAACACGRRAFGRWLGGPRGPSRLPPCCSLGTPAAQAATVAQIAPPPTSTFTPQYDRRSQFDRIVIETTGLAQPAPIIQTFFLEPAVSDRMRLDGVVTMVRFCVCVFCGGGRAGGVGIVCLKVWLGKWGGWVRSRVVAEGLELTGE